MNIPQVGQKAAPAGGANGVVATSHPLATQVGLEALRRGGTAVDAAVAASFALGVVEPYMSGIGGGCFTVLHDGPSGELLVLDARGVAPAAATEDMFVRNGQVQVEDTVIGSRAVLVPGLVAGLTTMHTAYGRLPLAELVEPAARLAEEGYAVSPMFAALISANPYTLPALRANAEAAAVYLPRGEAPAPGVRLANPDLARTYRMIGREGADAFYRGAIAEAIASEMRRSGGLITGDDLAAFQPRRQTPVWAHYREYEVCSLAPPSAGGMFLAQCLGQLEGFGLPGRDRYAAETLHLLAEVMKLAYADRAHYIGDPRFADVPLAGLIDKDYIALRAALIDSGRARPASPAGDPWAWGRQSNSTTHLCAADREGTVVALTQTIGNAFASGVVPRGTGLVLNHLMGDFSPALGAATAHGWGAYTSCANAIAPGKTPTSSNAPTIVYRNGTPLLAVGAAGGSRILSAVLQVVLNALDCGWDIGTAIAAARIHDQGAGLEVESQVSPEVRERLAALGHTVVNASGYHEAMFCYAQGVAVDQEHGLLWGAADPRDDGLALAY